MAKKIIDALIITSITFILVFLSGNIYAFMWLSAQKQTSYRSHNKYTDPDNNRYKKNIDTEEVNLYGDLCAIEGTYELCAFSDGKRRHQFKTDQYGYKTTGNIDNADLVFVGDSFLAVSGGDDMSEQFGSIFQSLTGIKMYEAPHPGDINDYNKRHLFFKEKNPNAKFVYLLFEGNDFIDPKTQTIDLLPKTKSLHHLRFIYVPIREVTSKLPLTKLVVTMFETWKAKSTAGTENSQVLVKELKNGRKQAFYKVYIPRTNLDQSISNENYTYINNNADSICGIIYIPTAYAIYLSEYSLQQRHPSLFKQFSLLQKRGIDVIDLTPYLRKASQEENGNNQIWWSDDTHWNSQGIKVGVLNSLKSIKCMQN